MRQGDRCFRQHRDDEEHSAEQAARVHGAISAVSGLEHPRIQRVPDVVDPSPLRVARSRVAGEEVEGMALVGGLHLPIGPREHGEVGGVENAGDQPSSW